MGKSSTRIRVNPFGHVLKLCHKGTSKEKIKNVPDFPRMMDIELTNLCNYTCQMCPVGNGKMKRKQGYMSGNVFQKIINELCPHRTPVRFIRWGEPLLHPQLLQFVKIAKCAGLLTHINSNGFFVDDNFISEIIKIPLDSIKFSFQGTNAKGYERMRQTDFFAGLVSVIKELYLRRNHRQSPYINIGTTVTTETPEQIKSFKEQMGKIADSVWIGKTAELETTNKCHSELCPEVFDKLSVNWDGLVTACCGDWDNMMLVGDVKEQTLEQIWKDKPIQHFRQMLADMRHGELDLCRRCARNDLQARVHKGV